jgi:hypothetical protein
MSDPLEALLGAGAVPDVSFPPTSRYAGVGLAAYVPTAMPGAAGGQEAVPIAFLKRRFVPKPERFGTFYEYSCVEGDRRDLVAAVHLQDADLWWRLADANGVIDPTDLASPVGRRLRITGEASPHPGGAGG